MFREIMIQGARVLQYDANRFRVDANGALCPSGAVPDWVTVPLQQVTFEEIRFKTDPKTWGEDVQAILADSFAFRFWALWKRGHLVSQDFNRAVLEVANILRNAAPSWNAEEYAARVWRGGVFHDLSLDDLRPFFAKWLPVFRGDQLLIVLITEGIAECERL